MAKKTVYIQGHSARQKFSDGKPTAEVSGFWHIKRPRAQFRTLCGMDYDEVTERTDRPTRAKTVCTFCERIAAGRDPVFDRRSEEGYDRPERIGGTGRIAKIGSFNSGTQVA